MKKRGRPKKEVTDKKVTNKVITGKKRGRPRKITDNNITGKKVIGKYNTGNEDSDKGISDKSSKVVSEPLTREQMELRREKVRATLPKIDLHKTREVFDLTKDKDLCKSYTSFACHRPDIYLDRGCRECSLQKNCECPIKDINRIPDGRAPKLKKFVTKPKIS